MLEQFNAVDIPLSNGGFTTVDIQDAPRVLRYRWHGKWNGTHTQRYARRGGDYSPLSPLHRYIVAQYENIDGKEVDHQDGNPLNNRRSNLRSATTSQNQANRRVDRDNKLGVKGVRLRKSRYVAQIKVLGRQIHLGSFGTLEDASHAYQRAAREHFGEFANSGLPFSAPESPAGDTPIVKPAGALPNSQKERLA